MQSCSAGERNSSFSLSSLLEVLNFSLEGGLLLHLSLLTSFSSSSSPLPSHPGLRHSVRSLVCFLLRTFRWQENRSETPQPPSPSSCVSLLFECNVYIYADVYSLLSCAIRPCEALLCVCVSETSYTHCTERLTWLRLRLRLPSPFSLDVWVKTVSVLLACSIVGTRLFSVPTKLEILK